MREGAATGGRGRGRVLGCQMEGAYAGKVNPGMLYNGLHQMLIFGDEMLKLSFKNLK